MTSSSDAGWTVFRRDLARAVFGGGSYDALPGAATAALLAGCDSSALNELAGMEGSSWSELRIAVDSARREVEADLASRGEWFSAAHGHDPVFERPNAVGAHGDYEDHQTTTDEELARRLTLVLDGHRISKGSDTTAGAVWEAFLAFARERVAYRGAPIDHEIVQVEAAGEFFTLARICTLEDENGDYEGQAEGFIEFEVPGALPLDDDLVGIPLTGSVGEMGPRTNGEPHEYRTLEDLDRVVRTRVLGAMISSPATVTATSASGA